MAERSNGRRISFGEDVLEYDDRGEGDPILLLHAGAFSDWFAPVAAAEELKGFRIILPRRAGYVEGVVPSGHLSLADHARHSASLLDGIGVHRVHMCGHSSSALIGLQLALDRPDLVHSLVLLEPAPGGGLNGPAHAAVVGEKIGAAMAAYGAGDTATGFERFMSAVGGPHHREVIEKALGPEGYENAVRQSAFFPDEARAVWEWRFDAADAERIQAPLLVVEGERTAHLSAVPPESVSLLAAMVPSAETTVLPGASHLMPLEDPGGVARLIADFARRHPIKSSAVRLLGIALTALVALVAPVQAQEYLAITATTIIDGGTGRAMPGMTIVIEGERIVAVGATDSVQVPPTATVIDGSGKWVVPGYIDVHTHAGPLLPLQRLLALGITTIHTMPGTAAPADTFRAREAWSHRAESSAPRLHITFPMFTAVFPADRFTRSTNFVKPQSVAEVEQRLPVLRSEGYAGIKVVLDDGRPWMGSDSATSRLPPEIFRSLVEQARLQEMRSYVHVTQLADAEDAIAAGANVFMHGIMDAVLPDALLHRMRERGVVWAPAIRIIAAGADFPAYARRVLADSLLRTHLTDAERTRYADAARQTEPAANALFPKLPRNGAAYVRTLNENTRLVRAHGVSVAVGSDSGDGIGTHIEMVLLQEAGMSPAEVLIAATYGGAVAMALDESRGTIEPGKLADLVVLTRDPLDDIRHARAISAVIKGGRVAWRREGTVGAARPRSSERVWRRPCR